MTTIESFGVYLLKSIDEALEKFKEYRFLFKNQTGMKVKNFLTENGLEFCCEASTGLCRKNGIIKHKIVPKIP